jgi:benzoate/toluate 1,2-dioxygenase beta subunit
MIMLYDYGNSVAARKSLAALLGWLRSENAGSPPATRKIQVYEIRLLGCELLHTGNFRHCRHKSGNAWHRGRGRSAWSEVATLSVEDLRQFLYREARFLDDKEWESWLALYAPDAEYWVPSWDDDQLVTDPQTQISLIWYGHKGGLEDRVFRIRTERSSATSMPEPRTSHNISNVEILAQGGGVCELRFNWVTLSYRYKTVDTYFGTSFYTLDTTAAQPLIKRKKVILKNDYIHHVVDIYHL